MKKIEGFQITGMTLSGFKSYQEPTHLDFGPLTLVTGGNGRGKTSVADAIAFAITGLPFFGKRGIDRLHNESNPALSVSLSLMDNTGQAHTLTRMRHRDRMTITFDGYELRQVDLSDMFGERDVFLSIFNPLYFIELGESGKRLLEMYLPTVPHEAVLAQLSEKTREALRDEQIFSPDTYLKNRREEIRNLKESILYLTGQKDLAVSQNQDREQKLQELELRRSSLQSELSALEERRFSGMDVPAMQEQLGELSARYEELVRDGRDGTTDTQDALITLRSKIAQRQAEPYHSKYTKALADAQAKINELGGRYTREVGIFRAMVPGTVCPTCHRAVTAENLKEVQSAIKCAADAIAVEGKECRAQFDALMELDQKSRDTFEQFKAEDIEKWSAEAEALETKRRECADAAGSQAETLRQQMQSLVSDLEYGTLSQEEYDRMISCQEELHQCEADLKAAQSVGVVDLPAFDQQIKAAEEQIEALERKISDAVLYVSKRAEMTFSKLKMNKVAFSLYDVVKSTGEVRDAFKFTFDGRNYDRLSLSEKIRAGMEVSELLKRLTGRNYPVFVDNMESVDDLANVHPTGQVIMARCVRGQPLSVSPVQQQVKQAA